MQKKYNDLVNTVTFLKEKIKLDKQELIKEEEEKKLESENEKLESENEKLESENKNLQLKNQELENNLNDDSNKPKIVIKKVYATKKEEKKVLAKQNAEYRKLEK